MTSPFVAGGLGLHVDYLTDIANLEGGVNADHCLNLDLHLITRQALESNFLNLDAVRSGNKIDELIVPQRVGFCGPAFRGAEVDQGHSRSGRHSSCGIRDRVVLPESAALFCLLAYDR